MNGSPLTALLNRVRERCASSPSLDPLDAVEFGVPSQQKPCEHCGQQCNLLLDELYLHVACFQLALAAATAPTAANVPPPAAPATVGPPVVAPATPAPRLAQRAQRPTAATAGRQRRMLAGVLDARGVWLPEQPEPTVVELPRDIAGAYSLANELGVRQLWIHPQMHEQLEIPTKRDLDTSPAAGVPHDWTDASQVRCDPDGLASWVNVSAEGSPLRSAVVFPAFESRCAWSEAVDGPDLLAGLLSFAAELGENYYWSPNVTGEALLGKTATADLSELGEEDMPPPAGNIKEMHRWSRQLRDEEDLDDAWIHRYDLNGAQPAVFGIIQLAVAPYQHHTEVSFEAARDKNRAGYWLASIPRTGAWYDLGLPGLLEPWLEADKNAEARGEQPGGPAWVCTDMLVLLAELEVPIEVHEAWIAAKSARAMRKTNERYRAARTALMARRDAGSPGGAIAYDTLKAVFTSRIGDFAHEGARMFRPDVRDAILTRAFANQYRKLRAVAKGKLSDPEDHGTGRFPLALHEDAVYYVAEDSDPWRGAPRTLPIGDRSVEGQFGRNLGEYDWEASLPLSVMLDEIGGRRFHAAFYRASRGAMKDGRR